MKTFSGYLYVSPDVAINVHLKVSLYLRSISKLVDGESEALEVYGVPEEVLTELRSLYPLGVMGSYLTADVIPTEAWRYDPDPSRSTDILIGFFDPKDI
jgi:hypothetical protein